MDDPEVFHAAGDLAHSAPRAPVPSRLDEGDTVRIYEINPIVERLAQTEFTFFPHSPADKKINMGDARLVLEGQESQQFDVLAVDAFSRVA